MLADLEPLAPQVVNAPRAKGGNHPVEFTAIILAGYGGSLYPLTEPENVPKALLPIANKPMISYPLTWLEQAGITTVIIVCQEEAESKISHWVKNGWKGSGRPSVVAVSSEDEAVGSADALRDIKDKIKTDFIVISCDSILEMPAYKVSARLKLETC